jgi:TDG/mug DNA glycosylase family protein
MMAGRAPTTAENSGMCTGPIDAGVPTLPDLLREALDVVFVGINPSIYSAERGRYFARASNRFWPCLSQSSLSQRARDALVLEVLGPQHDRTLLEYGIGFTDVAKRPTAKASELAPSELAAGVAALLAKLDQYQPRVACFHGVTGYQYVHRLLADSTLAIRLGPQDLRLGPTRIYLVPNPSGANAHFTRADQTCWYDRLARHLDDVPTRASPCGAQNPHLKKTAET